jgi:hypothetical protein
MYRLKIYHPEGNATFSKRTYTKMADAIKIAQLKLVLFNDTNSKIDIYKDDKLTATVYG